MTSIDLTPILQSVLGLCALALTTFGGIALQALAKRANVQVSAQQTASFDDALSKSLAFGVSQSLDAIKAKGWDHPEVKSQVLGMALNQAVARFPDALKAVGLTPDLSDPKNTATITEALNRALPAAFSVAAASPATPPVENAVAVANVASPAPATASP